MSNPLEPTAPVIGLRQWRLTESGDRLRGISADVEWAVGDDEAHKISEAGHDGFHAYAPACADDLGGWSYAPYGKTDTEGCYVHITGVVIGWGRVFVHKNGWRSEFVRPIAFASWEAHVKEWAKGYTMEKVIEANPGWDVTSCMAGGEQGFTRLARHYGVQTVDSLQGCVRYAVEEGLGVVLDPVAHMVAEHEDFLNQATKKDQEAAELRAKAEALVAKFTAKNRRNELVGLIAATKEQTND